MRASVIHDADAVLLIAEGDELLAQQQQAHRLARPVPESDDRQAGISTAASGRPSGVPGPTCVSSALSRAEVIARLHQIVRIPHICSFCAIWGTTLLKLREDGNATFARSRRVATHGERRTHYVEALARGLSVIGAFGQGRRQLSLSDVARVTSLPEGRACVACCTR